MEFSFVCPLWETGAVVRFIRGTPISDVVSSLPILTVDLKVLTTTARVSPGLRACRPVVRQVLTRRRLWAQTHHR
uniref:Uncharacterized protein n=1 Tax=Hucho hucho TaxID=62062 RepID=A0A4W5MLC5_9TELE